MSIRAEGQRPRWLAQTDVESAEAANGGSAAALEALGPSANGYGPAQAYDPLQGGIDRLREAAIQVAREDAASGLPDPSNSRGSETELELKQRCKAFFQRWQSQERRRLNQQVADIERDIAGDLGSASLEIDRFERFTNDLCRLKAKTAIHRQEVNEELEKTNEASRGLPTKVYLLAISFLGIVEFFANAPVFSALLPRDELTERQIQLVAETSSGWLAGVERVFAQFILRPDAALLAAGVITFLCVLAHFFGHSLRELVMHRDKQKRTTSGKTSMESVIPMILSGVGLLLVLGVLYEARVTLGEVGEKRFQEDVVVVEELRRNAGWLRVDGDLLAANEQANRADDMEAAAMHLREYAASMSRLSFPILLLNMTLVLCAISAAYFHQRDVRQEVFNESPFETERVQQIDFAETSAAKVSHVLADLVRSIRELKSLVTEQPLKEWRGVVHQLEAVIVLYRSENGRARELDPQSIPAFSKRVRLGMQIDEESQETHPETRDPEDYERERRELRERFESVRRRFTEEAIA
jgi:hypothetical protein